MLTSSTAILACFNVQQTADYYRDILGFKIAWLYETPPTFGCVSLGKAELFLCEQTETATRNEGHMHYFDCQDVEALHAQHQKAGANVISPLENKPWGRREYTVRDLNNYQLRFTGPEQYVKPPTATDSLPTHIAIEAKTPQLADYISLLESVNWQIDPPSMQQALDGSFLCMLAIDTRTNQPVGITRVVGAGKYFMIFDVVVRPSHQGQKIGTTLLQKTLEELRRRGAPNGSFVGLFTAKPAFYETLGFKQLTGLSITL